MRDRYELKTEIDSAQQDLQQNLAELREVITDKVDVRGKLQDRVAATKQRAMDYVVQTRAIAIDVVDQVRALVRDRPLVVAGVVGGLVLLGGLALTIRRELRAPRYVVFDLALEDPTGALGR